MSRWHYFLYRLLLAIPILFIVMTILFIILRMGPIDPVTAAMGPDATGPRAVARRQRLGLDEPLWTQYFIFVRDLVTLNLGSSWVVHEGRDVWALVQIFAPRTIWLGFWAILLPLFIGLPLGFYAGLNPNTWGDYIANFGGIMWQAMPNFWLAIMLLAVLRQTQGADLFDWYTIGVEVTSLIGTPPLDFLSIGWTGLFAFIAIPTSVSVDWGTLAVAIKMTIPPAIVLGSASMAAELRIGRTAVLEIANANFVETAKMKGVKNRVIVWKHIFRNALIPLIPVISNEAFILIGGAVIVETVFSINGLGRLFFLSAIQSDLTLAGGLLFIFTLVLIAMNIIQDFLYTIVDPRVGFDNR